MFAWILRQELDTLALATIEGEVERKYRQERRCNGFKFLANYLTKCHINNEVGTCELVNCIDSYIKSSILK